MEDLAACSIMGRAMSDSSKMLCMYTARYHSMLEHGIAVANARSFWRTTRSIGVLRRGIV